MDTVVLPGGLERDGTRLREVVIKPLTGHVEELLGDRRLPRPHWVSSVLAAAVGHTDGAELSSEAAEHMAVGDRLFLMLQLGIRYRGDEFWQTIHCRRCSSPFDVCLRPSELEVKPAEAWPTATLSVDGHVVELRSPRGRDQRWLVETRPPDPRRALLSRCVLSVDAVAPSPAFFEDLSTGQEAAIEAAIEAAGPDVDCLLLTRCPECGGSHEIDFNPYWFAEGVSCQLDVEVHTLAFNYHWSRSEILSLVHDQRRRYLRLIERERGLHG